MSDLTVLSNQTLLSTSVTVWVVFCNVSRPAKRTQTDHTLPAVHILHSLINSCGYTKNRYGTLKAKPARRATDRVTVQCDEQGRNLDLEPLVPPCLPQESGLRDNFLQLDEAERQRAACPFIRWPLLAPLRNSDQSIFHILHQMLRATLATGRLWLTQITVKLVPRSKHSPFRL